MSQTAGSKSKIPQTVGEKGKFEIQKKLGAGCFGEVFRGIKVDSKEQVAAKFEELSSGAPQLEHEASILNILRQPVQPQGFAEYYYFGREGSYQCLVMEHLGRSLEDCVQKCKGKFTVKTTTLIAEQILRRIEYLHSKGIVHRDIKPENFMMGVGQKQHHIYLIDFGLSKRYFDKGKHAPLKQKLSLTGTARYASLNAHRGVEQSRRDDLEAIGHMLLYFLRGSLPWSGLEARTKQEKYRFIKEKKETTPLHDLGAGFPESFENYLAYCRNLGFKDRPDYKMLQKLFRDVRLEVEKEQGTPIQDKDFEWLERAKDLGTPVPLDATADIRQPDDDPAAGGRSRGLCCFCGGKSQVAD